MFIVDADSNLVEAAKPVENPASEDNLVAEDPPPDMDSRCYCMEDAKKGKCEDEPDAMLECNATCAQRAGMATK